MINIHIDPALVALPNGLAESGDELQVVIERGISVASWARGCNAFNLLKTSDFELALEATGNFPSFDSIRETLIATNLEGVFSEKDILQNVLLIMERAAPVLDQFGSEVSQVSAVHKNVLAVFERHPVALRQASVRSLATLAWLEHLGMLRPAHFLASGNPAVGSGHIRFKGLIDEILRVDDGASPELPALVETDVPTIESADEVINVIAALDVWRAADTASQLHLAIFAKACRLAQTIGATRSDFAKFRIGSEFLSSLRAHQAVGRYASSTLETCARIVLGSPKYEVSAFGGTRADGLIGKRTHVTKHVAALRLMYWESTTGDLEFANVGPKGELVIEPGEASRATTIDYPEADVA